MTAARLPLRFACGKYDRMEALRMGEVAAEGIDLDYLAIEEPREIFDRMVGELAFDLSELSASEFICQEDRGHNPFVAIPVFPSRAFRHGFVFINRDKGIAAPKDLDGKRIGVALYTIRWVEGAVEKPGAHGTPHALPILKRAPIEPNRSGKSLSDLLATG